MDEHVNANAVDNCRDAIDYLTRAASLRPDLSCTWKLLGEACTLTHVLPRELVSFEVPAKLVNGREGEETMGQSKDELVRIGTRCYVRALQLVPDNAECWHDLALNYNVQAEMDCGKVKEFRHKALSAVKKALTLNSKSHQHWNLLGVIAASSELQNHALAQHAFIKSIEAENNAIAWTNLGILYLLLGWVLLNHNFHNRMKTKHVFLAGNKNCRTRLSRRRRIKNLRTFAVGLDRRYWPSSTG